MIVMNDVWRESQLEIIAVKIVGYSSPRHGCFTDRPTVVTTADQTVTRSFQDGRDE